MPSSGTSGRPGAQSAQISSGRQDAHKHFLALFDAARLGLTMQVHGLFLPVVDQKSRQLWFKAQCDWEFEHRLDT